MKNSFFFPIFCARFCVMNGVKRCWPGVHLLAASALSIQSAFQCTRECLAFEIFWPSPQPSSIEITSNVGAHVDPDRHRPPISAALSEF